MISNILILFLHLHVEHFRSGGYTDSDTGAADPDGKSGKKRVKRERKKTAANLGPRIKVLRISPIEAGVEAEEGETEAKVTEPGKADVKVILVKR